MMRALALTGPTASGKTALSLFLAKRLSGEIISCDSMQIYRGMDIGTAKATERERSLVRHHLIDVVSPSENYSAEDYRADALAAVRDITSRGGLPIFVGGTGLYIDTVIRGTSPESPPSDPKVRERLAKEADRDGAESLWRRLFAVDPSSAEKTHPNNLRRVIRALEIYELSGKTKSYFDERSRTASPDVSVGMITLDFHNRDLLYERIDARVDEMLAEGLEREARSLYERGLLAPEYTSAQAIGYKEMLAYIRGECSLGEAVELIKLSSRRYAKRQLTWFRHESDAVRIFVDGEDGFIKERELLVSEVAAAAETLMNLR